MALNEVFSSAVNYERRARWKQVVKKYKEMFALLRERSSDDKIDENSLKMLLYECHFHCGLAYHHLDQLTDAITHFMSAMRVISRKKINCCVGCITGKVLHFHVPVLAKISICHIQQGEYETALKKVEEALVLDFKNPDLFCIRACAYYLLKNKTGFPLSQAMQDVNFSIWLRPKHVCAWLLRGLFKEKQKEERSQNDGKNTDLEMACSLEASISAYATANNFSSSVHHILNRYLPSLRVSHTITASDVFREHNSELQLNVSNKSRAPFRLRKSSTREHRCKSHEKELEEEKMEKPRNGKEETTNLTFTATSLSVIPSLSMLMICEDNNLKMRARSEPAFNKMADTHLLTYSLSRERAMTNMSLEDRRKTPFPANGIKVKDLLDVNVRAEHPQGDGIRRVERSLGTPQIGRMTSFPVTHKGSLYFPCRMLKVRRRHEDQERLYARMWTQNQYPVRIPDSKGCRSTADFESR